jgi:ADP-ribosylglycohydrolase
MVRRYWTGCTLVALAAALPLVAQARPAARRIPLSELRDRVAGGWAGQMIGVSFGAPTEFHALAKTIDGDLPHWKPDNVSGAIDQDDLYVDMTFARVLDEKGLSATSQDFGDMFRDSRYRLWHANLAARRALRRGVPATETGTPRYNVHANDIDFQIESDFIGLMTPGLPATANDFCLRAGRVMNFGDGIYGGMFVSGMYAAAFFDSDPRRIVEAGLASIPAASPYARLITDVLAWSRQYPDDWKDAWNHIEAKWDTREACPEGAARPFNIDAKLNGGYIALALLYGHGNFGRTIEIATRAGQDSDCNPSSAAGIIGVTLGYSRIPDEWKGGIPAIANAKFNYTDYSFNGIVDSTVRRALALIRQTGGRIDGETAVVMTERPKAPKLAIWNDFGAPVERITTTDSRWKWTGAWSPPDSRQVRRASASGSEATVTFAGTGAVLSGPYLPDGGKADVFLDGRLNRTVDSNSDEEQSKNSEAVWHIFGLRAGPHTVRVVVRGEEMYRGKGATVGLEDLIVFRK